MDEKRTSTQVRPSKYHKPPQAFVSEGSGLWLKTLVKPGWCENDTMDYVCAGTIPPILATRTRAPLLKKTVINIFFISMDKKMFCCEVIININNHFY